MCPSEANEQQHVYICTMHILKRWEDAGAHYNPYDDIEPGRQLWFCLDGAIEVHEPDGTCVGLYDFPAMADLNWTAVDVVIEAWQIYNDKRGYWSMPEPFKNFD